MLPRIHQLLSQQIRDAFADAAHPGNANIVSPAKGYDPERIEIASFFADKRWDQLSVLELRYYSDAVFFFTPEAYRYFIPAYLLVSIEQFVEADVIPAAVLRTLSPLNWPRFLGRLEVLSPAMRDVIRKFLIYCRDELAEQMLEPNPVPLAKYWLEMVPEYGVPQ